MRHFLTILMMWSVVTAVFAQQTIRLDDQPKSYPPMVSKGELLGSIPALRDLKPNTKATMPIPPKMAYKRNYFQANELKNPSPMPPDGDPLAKNRVANRESGPEVIPGLNFEGNRDGSIDPPDPTGAIGKHHYVQMTNANGGSWFQVWDKTTGASVYGPIHSSTFWDQVNSGSVGDPIVKYDHDAERWLIMEMQGIFTNELLIAISDDSDPTGGWKAYRIQTVGWGDYPKLYIWPNAYFITVNEIIGGNNCTGYALERSDILAGAPFFDLYRFVMPNYTGINFQPATAADWDPGPPPPAGSPGYMFRVYDDAWEGGQDHLQIWKVQVDWNNPGQSSITGPDRLYPTPFETKVCYGNGLFDCLEQPGDAPRITALENIIMYRAAYRNFGTYESVLFNHVTDVSGQVGQGGDAAIRWYELRKQAGTDWAIYQEGTYAPDIVTNRFMATIASDEAGNIGLGYSAVSEFLYPGLYLTGRRSSDPLGEMTLQEYTLMPGQESHNGQRWGDYSSLHVDPEDGRTFWFTGEYRPEGPSWGTRIGSFKVQRDTFDLKPTALTAPVPSSFLGNNEQVRASFLNGGIEKAEGFSASLYFEGNLVVTEPVPLSIESGESAEFTFSSTVDMSELGKTYHFMILTEWNKDQFRRNDTLRTSVRKLTSNDVEVIGKYNLPGLVCGSETDFGIIIRNASGLPMQSAKVHWRINSQPTNIYDWTGNLAPGERDTINFTATGILNGLNSLTIFATDPNGMPDEDGSNNTLFPIKFNGNLSGTYLTAEAQTNFGVLVWELRTQANGLLAFGELSTGQNFTQICSNDQTCYNLILRSGTFSWQGQFKLYDIYGNVLLEANSADPAGKTYLICTPPRQQIDLGALSLVSPVSNAGLGAAEPVTIRFRNFGQTDQNNIELAYRLNGGNWNIETFSESLNAGGTRTYTFATTEDLSTQGGIYVFEIRATVPNDEQPGNDAVSVEVRNRAVRELEVTNVRTVQACSDPDFALLGVTVRNNGLGDNHQFDLLVKANGVQQPAAKLFETIPPDESTEILLIVQGLQFGPNTVEVDITNVNGHGEDEQPDNDTGSLSFELSADGFSVQLFFSTNDSPSENRWEVRDEQGNIIQAGGPYPQAFGFYIEEICLQKDQCYVFHLYDTGGNGMDGGIVVLSSPLGVPLWSYFGGNFGDEVSAQFCTVELCAGFSAEFAVVCPGNATLNDGKITAMPIGGTAPYQYSLDGADYQPSPVFENLTNGFYGLSILDANGCAFFQIVDLCLVNTVEPGFQRSMKVSPNPTKGMASIELPAVEGEESLLCEVLDARGKWVQSFRLVRWDDTLRGMAVLDNAPAGIYFIRVKGLPIPLTARLIKQ